MGISLAGSKNSLMGYAEFKGSPKALVTSDQVGPGQINSTHLEAGLFSEIKSIGNHNHSGTKSRRVKTSDLEGPFGTGGFFIYSSDGTKRYRVTVDSGTGLFVLTEA